MGIIGIVAAILIAYIVYGVIEQRRHDERMYRLTHRIHVNGIRGKSSVTRLIAAGLREGGLKTAAKTTGSAARIIIDHDNDTPVVRKEPDIAEQRRMLSYYTGDLHRMYTGEDYTAVVFECMAVNPLYQRYLEEKIMHSTIGVITNIREDHVEAMGTTLPQIARSLANTIPRGGHLVTAEVDPELLDILQQECDARGTQLHAVGDMPISDRHMAKFSHFEYKENVAVALTVAKLAGIPRATALKGMHRALPDPGAFSLQKYSAPKDKEIYWANLFAINDRESFILTVNALAAKLDKKTKKAVILNNRQDRPERVAQFVNVAVTAIKADYIFTFGDYEAKVKQELKKYPKAKVTVVYMGNSSDFKNADGQTLFDTMAATIKQKACVIYGAVNIHTPQAQALLSVVSPEVKNHGHK